MKIKLEITPDDPNELVIALDSIVNLTKCGLMTKKTANSYITKLTKAVFDAMDDWSARGDFDAIQCALNRAQKDLVDTKII